MVSYQTVSRKRLLGHFPYHHTSEFSLIQMFRERMPLALTCLTSPVPCLLAFLSHMALYRALANISVAKNTFMYCNNVFT